MSSLPDMLACCADMADSADSKWIRHKTCRGTPTGRFQDHMRKHVGWPPQKCRCLDKKCFCIRGTNMPSKPLQCVSVLVDWWKPICISCLVTTCCDKMHSKSAHMFSQAQAKNQFTRAWTKEFRFESCTSKVESPFFCNAYPASPQAFMQNRTPTTQHRPTQGGFGHSP